jgi:mono/diheme cytochrome c family protein
MHPLPLLLTLGALQAPASPSAKLDPAAIETGLYLYTAHCAVCHGRGAEGDGPLADQLRTRPPDLTRLATRNRGRFPADLLPRIIDGREPAKGHGGPEMPIWGDVFKERREGYSEAVVKRRIASLVQHLESLQKK